MTLDHDNIGIPQSCHYGSCPLVVSHNPAAHINLRAQLHYLTPRAPLMWYTEIYRLYLWVIQHHNMYGWNLWLQVVGKKPCEIGRFCVRTDMYRNIDWKHFLRNNDIFIWWCHQIETFSALLALCVGNSPVIAEFPAQRPVTPNLDVFFDLRLNKRSSKQSRRRSFEMPSCSLWRHCYDFCVHIHGCESPCNTFQFACSFIFEFDFTLSWKLPSELCRGPLNVRGPLLLTWVIFNFSMDK